MSLRHAFRPFIPVALALFAVAALALAACSSEEKPKFPAFGRGNTLTIVAKEVRLKDVIYYQDSDTSLYSLRPSEPDRKLAAVRVQVYNGKSNTAIMRVDEKGYILLDKPAKEYKPVNPFGETRRLAPNLPSNEELFQFIWGEFEIPKENSIEAWTIFDIPRDVQPSQLRWDALETVFVRFFPIK